MGDLDEEWHKLLPPPSVSAYGDRAERVAVVALPARDHVAAPWLYDLHEVLARQLERRFHRFGSARNGRRVPHELFGECLHRLVGEEGVCGNAMKDVRHGGMSRQT